MQRNTLVKLLSVLVAAAAVTNARADYASTVQSLNPVAYWPLDETNQPPPVALTAKNLGLAGSDFDGFYGIAAFPDAGALVGDTDGGVFFDGSADGHINVPYGSVLSANTPFTAEAWLNPNTVRTDDNDVVCALSDGHFASPRAGWLLYQAASGWNFRMYNQNGGNTSLSLIGGPAPSPGVWQHVAVVYDGTNGFIYVNGALAAGPVAPTGYVPNPDSQFSIAQRSDNSFQWNGFADEVAFYTNALTASQVLSHYQNGTNTAPSQSYNSLILAGNPLLYYRLDDTATTPPPSTAVATNHGSFGATVNGTYLAGTRPARPGPFGAGSRACQFIPQSGGYVDCTADTSLDITNSITVLAWFKGSPIDGRFQSFLGRSDSSWRADVDPSGLAHWADGGNPDATGQIFVNDANWHFFAGVYDGSTNYLYIDGALDVATAAGTPIAGDTTRNMVIGGVGDYLGSGGRLFQGSVAQVAVYTNALSAAQIQTVYNAATLPPQIKQQPASINVNQGTAANFTVGAYGSPTLNYLWYHGTTFLSGNNSSTLTLNDVQPGDAGNYTVIVTNQYGAVTSAVATLTVLQGPPTLLTDIKPLLSTNFTGMPNAYSVSVGGTPPFTYVWKRDGAAVPGATNSAYSFATLSGTHTYSCVISNSLGGTNSATATVVERYTDLGTTFVVNFHDAMGAQYAATTAEGDANMWTNVTYQGLGGYPDAPGNTNWNGFGYYVGYQPIFDSSVSPQRASDGSLIPITLTTTYNFDSGALYFYGDGTPGNTCADCPSLVMGYFAVANGANPIGTFTLHNVPPGTYSLYLYSANYDNDRGSMFTVNSGGAHNGWNATTNTHDMSPANYFTEGQTYVYFTNVTPTVSGTITGTFAGISNNITGQSGEGDFNGLQLVKLATTLPALTVTPSGTDLILNWSPGVGILQSADNVAGPYTDMPTALPPYHVPMSGTQKFYRIRL